MKLYRESIRKEGASGTAVLLVMLVMTTSLAGKFRAEAAPNVMLWDTHSHFGPSLDISNRSGWKIVPSDLFALEVDPPKASSDPGYYGREYSFLGDAVVENHWLAAVFRPAEGRVVIYVKDNPNPTGDVSQPAGAVDKKILELGPLLGKTKSANIKHIDILRNATDEVALDVSFSITGSADATATFAFGKTGIVEIKPAENMKGISLWSAIEYGVVPGFVGDDLIFSPGEYPAAKTLCIPAENLFLGLLRGEENALVMTWPKGRQQMRLQLADDQGKRLVESVEFESDGQSLYLAALSAPGVWHAETLDVSSLEKEVTINWKRPFRAKWKTQLYEEGTKTTFAFRDSKGEIWRGVPGSYRYPVWFNGEQACYYLGKKVPPKGESLIYFVEGRETPPGVGTPVDILKATLGGPMSGPILDMAGRKLRTHHRRGGEGVRRACTCGCTEAIQAVFDSGEEGARKDYIAGALEDMSYFVHRHVERIDQYRRFADEMINFVQAKANASAELKPFLDGLEQTVRRILEEYEVQKENMKSFAYADDLARRTLALANSKEADNLKASKELLKAWRDMGGAQDYVLAQCHTITRKLDQQAGYGCVEQPNAVALAEEIRARCRQCLRNPDGYEIWANY